MKHGRKFAVVTLCAAATLAGAVAMAQQQDQGQQPQAQPPAQDQRQAPQQQTRNPGEDFRGFWRGGMMGQGGRNLSEADRTAFFEARLAALKAGLMLNDTQQALWPPVESAVREIVKQREEWAQRIRTEPRPDNFADRMKREGEMMSARGAAMIKFADAIKPFYDSLSDEQKRRLSSLMRAHDGRGAAGRRGDDERRGMGMRGEHRQRWNNEERRGYERRGWDDRDNRGRGGERNWERQGDRRWDRDDRGEGDRNYGRRSRQDAPGDNFGFGDRR